jgi:tetratricopeptide (TPR) repeat protein
VTARTALDSARPVLARMELSRGPENTRTDLIAVWSAVEAALRTLIGDPSVGGQALIREARSRQLLNFDQANALVAFQTVRERLDSTGYQPTDSDVNSARSAFLKLDAGLMSGTGGGSPAITASPYAQPGSAYAAPPPSSNTAPAPAVIIAPSPGLAPMMKPHRKLLVPVMAGVVALLVIGGLAWWLVGRGGNDDLMAQGISAYQKGDRVTASSDFERAARADAKNPMPHVYLARMAREVGNYTVANQELQLALTGDPRNLQGRREYGALFLSQGKYDDARVWYTHALEIDPNDVTSQGWLGCSLVKLNRMDEGLRWLSRAGTGPWSVCRTAAATAAGVAPP